MFEFRIIEMEDGSQVIDKTLKTPYEALTAIQMTEYMEVYHQLSYLETLKRRERREAEYKRKLARNPLYRFACMCGLV